MSEQTAVEALQARSTIDPSETTLDEIRSRVEAGQPLKAWVYYSHHNLWDSYKPFVEETAADRLMLLAAVDELLAIPPAPPASADLEKALRRLVNAFDPDMVPAGNPLWLEAQRLAERALSSTPAPSPEIDVPRLAKALQDLYRTPLPGEYPVASSGEKVVEVLRRLEKQRLVTPWDVSAARIAAAYREQARQALASDEAQP